MAIISGQWWRIFTAFLFQDGGIYGAVFNISSMLIVGGFAEQYLRRRLWFTILFLGYFISSMVGLLWQPIGAGNSIGVFSLAGSLLLISLTKSHRIIIKCLSILGILFALILTVNQDIHGIAVIMGIIISAIVSAKKEKDKA